MADLAERFICLPVRALGYWREELPGTELPWGAFGENLTIEGLLEDDVRVGDRLGVGSAQLVVTRPRKPCFKLAIRLGQRDMVARFRASGRSGFYLSVVREGELRAGDAMARLERGTGPTIPEMLADYNAMQTRIALPRPIADEFSPDHAGYVTRVEQIADAGGGLELQRDRVVAQLSRLSGEQAAFRYAPGKWSVTQVVGHLSDLERVFAYRLMRIGRGDDTPLPGIDENVVMRGAAFDRRAHADVLEEWVTVRNSTVSLVRGMPSEAWARYGRANDHLVTTRAIVLHHPRPRRAPPRSARRALRHPRVTQRAGLIQRGDVIGGGASLYLAYFQRDSEDVDERHDKPTHDGRHFQHRELGSISGRQKRRVEEVRTLSAVFLHRREYGREIKLDVVRGRAPACHPRFRVAGIPPSVRGSGRPYDDLSWASKPLRLSSYLDNQHGR